jgi:hypothetical protein
MDKKQAIGGTLALILLAFYTFLIVFAVLCVYGVGGLGVHSFTHGMGAGLATISGLIAALVIAELALTPPTEVPAGRAFAAAALPGQPAQAPGPTAKWVANIYLIIWLACGVLAYVVGDWLREPGLPAPAPDGLQALTDVGKSWLGLAVAAGYSYLGIKP